MNIPANYIEINKALWDAKTQVHAASAFYNVEGFINGQSSLKEVELGLLGNISGKTLLHLQCHFGQDTLSLARLGAKVTGVDFSGEAIKKARELNELLALDAAFVCCDIYELPSCLDEQFDIVFTSYGTIGWLPDMQRWAQVVARYLKPGGMFVFVDFHPVMWMFDSAFTFVQYPYFNKEAIVETLSGTYADRTADIHQQEIGWNHDLSEVMQSLVDAGLHLLHFKEYDYSSHNCFANMVETLQGRFQIAGMEGRLPMMYSLVMQKPV